VLGGGQLSLDNSKLHVTMRCEPSQGIWQWQRNVTPSIVVLQATNPTMKHPLQQVLGGGQVPSDHVDLNATLHYERRQRTWRWQRDAWQDALLQDNLHACQVLLPACPGRQLPVLAKKGLY